MAQPALGTSGDRWPRLQCGAPQRSAQVDGAPCNSADAAIVHNGGPIQHRRAARCCALGTMSLPSGRTTPSPIERSEGRQEA